VNIPRRRSATVRCAGTVLVGVDLRRAFFSALRSCRVRFERPGYGSSNGTVVGGPFANAGDPRGTGGSSGADLVDISLIEVWRIDLVGSFGARECETTSVWMRGRRRGADDIFEPSGIGGKPLRTEELEEFR